jgi:predicted oxidoreductase (fatty acid repression mutant protein)
LRERISSEEYIRIQFVPHMKHITSLKLKHTPTDFNRQKGKRQNIWAEEKSAMWGFKICIKNILLRRYQE